MKLTSCKRGTWQCRFSECESVGGSCIYPALRFIIIHKRAKLTINNYPHSNTLKALLFVLCSWTCNYQMYLLLVCCKRWLPHPQLHRVVGFFSFKLLTLLFSDFVEHMCHKVLVNCCLDAPATVFPGINACFSGLVIFLNAENLRAAFIIVFIFSQSNSYYET
jgi:hypothetical protein